MTPRPYVLAETTWTTVREEKYEVIVLPWGATEAHNLHLPYSTDIIESEAVAAEAARLAWDEGARVCVLPCVPFGVNTGQLDIPLTINMNPSTQLAVLTDVADSLAAQGFRKLVVLNGHGGNSFRQMIRELLPRHSRLFLCTLDWWVVESAAEYFDTPGDHAGEMETSLMMHLAGDLVRPLSDAGSGAARGFAVTGLREGWVWTQREWTKVTDDTGVGDPSRSDADKGRRFFEALTRKISKFLADLAKADPEQLYE